MTEIESLPERTVEAEVSAANILKTEVKAKFVVIREQNNPLKISLNRNLLSDICCITQTMHIISEIINTNNPKDKKKSLTKQELTELRIATTILHQLERRYDPHVRSYLNKLSGDNIQEFTATTEEEETQQP
jgi:hypothetical protein